MILIYISILLSSYLLSFATTNAAQQKISYNTVLYCYVENATGIYDAQEDESRVETAVCDFPAKTYRNSSTYNYSLPYMVNGNGVSERIPIIVEFNETITRNDTTTPLNYVIEGDGVVTSQAFNGYHAKALVISANNPFKCDTTTGVFAQSIMAQTHMAVFPASLSGQPLNDIRSNLTYTDHYTSIAPNIYYLFTDTLNSTGLVCSGSNLITYAPIN